jgi:hypothetical protein
MAEAEVALRLTEYLLGLPGAGDEASVAIDGAGVKVHGQEVFPVAEYLTAGGWEQTEQRGRNAWAGVYERGGKRMKIHSRSGVGDVVIRCRGRRVVVECKKGPLVPKKGSPERPLLVAAIGQAVTAMVDAEDLIAVAVPDSAVFRKLAEQFRLRPLFAKSGVVICLVARDGVVTGFPVCGE